MRPIKLKMSAFGSYVKPVEIDFETGLKGENFFLIHGATGSGKTTILDAICYALYGESSGGGRKSSMMRSENASPNEKTEVEFTFNLRGKIYRIVRSPKYERPKQRGGGTTEEKASARIFENNKPVETKDVSEYVRELLHFDSDQFRQVIMLPQGAFQKFLLARSDDKQKVLNMLFDAEFFKRAEDELKLKASAAQNEFQTLTTRKKGLLDTESITEEELPALIKEISDELEAAQEHIKALESQAADAQKNFSDGDNLSKAFDDLESKSQALTDAQNLLTKISDKLSAAKIEFEKRTAEESRRKELNQLVTDLGKKKDALGKLQAKRDKLKLASDAAKKSADKVNKLTEFKQRCDETMAELKAEVERLQDAPANLKVAERKLKDAQAREQLLREISELRRKKILEAEKNLATAIQECDAADKKLSAMRQAQSDGSAARLAANLIDGVPCPVCGAIHHPKPATSDVSIPTDEQIKNAESDLRTLTNKKNSAAENLAKLHGELDTKEKSLSDGSQVVTVEQAQADFDKLSADVKSLENYRERIGRGEEKIRDTQKALDSAQKVDREILRNVGELRGEVTAMERDVDEKYLADEKLLDEEISAASEEFDSLDSAFERAQENFNNLKYQFAAQKATVEAAEKNKAESAEKVEGKTKPDMKTLERIRDKTRNAEREAVESKAKLSARLERLNGIAKKISKLEPYLNTAEKNFLMLKTLSDVASGKVSKISFQRYYLATMFNEVITEANNRLERMSGGRYRFKSKDTVTDRRYSSGLDLEIFDDYTGTTRPVETLSGGESFLASLSLALGLAAVVQNNSGGIKLDTIFIDEGFGTLDTETLDFAMKTLIDLQSGGRLVGIISHVEELKNQMPVRLEITKGKTGSTARFVS